MTPHNKALAAHAYWRLGDKDKDNNYLDRALLLLDIASQGNAFGVMDCCNDGIMSSGLNVSGRIYSNYIDKGASYMI